MILKWIRSNKQIVIILICLIIICVCFPVMLYANANLPELVQRNFNDSLVILVEMQHESGGNFIEVRKDYIYLLDIFRRYMEERDYSLLLRVLYPELSPRKQLTSALANLTKKVTQEDEAENDIKKATETIARFVSESLKFASTQVSMAGHHDVPVELLNIVKAALDNSSENVEIYGNDQNMSNAEKACRKNRIAAALAYFIRCAYLDFNSLEDELKQFRGDINRTIYYNDLLMNNNEDLLQNDSSPEIRKQQLKVDNGLLVKYTKSELRRLVIVNALLDKDTHKAESFVLKSANISP